MDLQVATWVIILDYNNVYIGLCDLISTACLGANLGYRHYIDLIKMRTIRPFQGLKFNLKLCNPQQVSMTKSANPFL